MFRIQRACKGGGKHRLVVPAPVFIGHREFDLVSCYAKRIHFTIAENKTAGIHAPYITIDDIVVLVSLSLQIETVRRVSAGGIGNCPGFLGFLEICRQIIQQGGFHLREDGHKMVGFINVLCIVKIEQVVFLIIGFSENKPNGCLIAVDTVQEGLARIGQGSTAGHSLEFEQFRVFVEKITLKLKNIGIVQSKELSDLFIGQVHIIGAYHKRRCFTCQKHGFEQFNITIVDLRFYVAGFPGP